MSNIEELCAKYHWLKVGEDGVLEMFLDHHSLSSFRQCEGYFQESIMNSYRSIGRSWPLEFGIVFHKAVEWLYERKQNEHFYLEEWFGDIAALWNSKNMDEFSYHAMYKQLSGLQGFMIMMAQYAEHYSIEVDRLRVIATEIGFGKAKECFLGELELVDIEESTKSWSGQWKNVRCYLTGRIDFLMDSGTAIGPLDHKTTAFFKGNPINGFEVQEGMTGYVFATKHIIANKFPELLRGRKVDRIWMNFAQVTVPKEAKDRFKRVPLFKTDYQLEQYRLRQLRTFKKIYDVVVLGETADWNTSICSNMFHHECPYRNLHRQNDESSRRNILARDYVQVEPWNPDTVKD